jgi:hypothetical protein
MHTTCWESAALANVDYAKPGLCAPSGRDETSLQVMLAAIMRMREVARPSFHIKHGVDADARFA